MPNRSAPHPIWRWIGWMMILFSPYIAMPLRHWIGGGLAQDPVFGLELQILGVAILLEAMRE